MPDQPEYIELLNDIRLQEHRAGQFLQAWADQTPSPDLRGCLAMVAEREDSHGQIFERRIRELGHRPTDKDDPAFAERMRILGSDRPDLEKIAWLREAAASAPKPTVRDRYEAALDDESIDPLTRSLLRWFTDVENDSGAYMRQIYAQLESPQP